MQHDGKLDTFTFIGPLFIKKNAAREYLLNKNLKNVSQPKHFNKNTDTSNSAPLKAKIDHRRPKVNSVCFEYPYNHINHMYNSHDYAHLIDTHERTQQRR